MWCTKQPGNGMARGDSDGLGDVMQFTSHPLTLTIYLEPGSILPGQGSRSSLGFLTQRLDVILCPLLAG